MTVLAKLSDDLAAAAERQLRGATHRRRLTRGGLIAAACVVGAGGVATASGLWSPTIGDDARGHPTISPSSPPAEQLERFGVLRRAPTEADRGAQSLYALRFQGDAMQGVRTEYIRLLATRPDGRGSVLIPARKGYGKPDALCLFDQDTDGGGQSCWTTEEVARGAAVIGSWPASPVLPPALPPGDPQAAAPREPLPDRAAPQLLRRLEPLAPDARRAGGGRLSGLVPDGVAAVRIGDANPVSVHDNFFSAPWTPSPAAGGFGEITWLDADGAVVARG